MKPAEEARVVRKVDLLLMPILTITFGLQVRRVSCLEPSLSPGSITIKLYWETLLSLAYLTIW
jgi:hypothetical protein